MGFADELLNDNEEVVLDVRPHWSYMINSVALLAACFVAMLLTFFVLGGTFWWAGVAVFAAGGLVVFANYLQWQTTEFVVTNDRIITRIGVLSKAGTEIPLDRVMNISYRQSFAERILNVGDLMIESAGENGQQYFTDVTNPSRIQNIIYRQIEQDAEESRNGNSVRVVHHSDGPRRGGGGLGGRPGANTGQGGSRDRKGRGGQNPAAAQGNDSSNRSGSHSGSETSIPRQIGELDELRKRGILTDEEFNKKKKELLDRL